jgi:hypothetical protein
VTPYTLLCGLNVSAFATSNSALHYLNTSDFVIRYSLPYHTNDYVSRLSLPSYSSGATLPPILHTYTLPTSRHVLYAYDPNCLEITNSRLRAEI